MPLGRVCGLINREVWLEPFVPAADHAEEHVRAGERGAQGLAPFIIPAPLESRFCFHAIAKNRFILGTVTGEVSKDLKT